MRFKEQHEDYLNYESSIYYTQKIPNSFFQALKGYIIGHVNNATDFKEIVKIVAKNVPCDPGSNWGLTFLHDDLDNSLFNLMRKDKFYKVMDCIREIVEYQFISEIEDINEILEDEKIGYYLEYDNTEGVFWNIRGNIESYSNSIAEAIKETPQNVYANTIEHLNQAKQQLLTDSQRSIKDAVRDCASALEAHLKYLSDEKDFRSAVKTLEGTELGNKKILRDAIAVWSYIHEDIPDIRHGDSKTTLIRVPEALYLIDKMTALINYLNRTYTQ